jgi:DNA-directed RNA polymerase specialized sigma24 family protein
MRNGGLLFNLQRYVTTEPRTRFKCEYEKDSPDKIGRTRQPGEMLTAFSSDNGSAFTDYRPKLESTNIFVLHFFAGWTYEDLAKKYDKPVEYIQKMTSQAKKRIIDILTQADQPSNLSGNVNAAIEKVKQSSGTLTRAGQYFILNKVLGMRPVEIAELFGHKQTTDVNLKLKALARKIDESGFKDLFEYAPNWKARAKQSLSKK